MPNNQERGVNIQLTEDGAMITQGGEQINSVDQIPPWAVMYILAVAAKFDPSVTSELGIRRSEESRPAMWEIERRRKESGPYRCP